MTEPPAPSLLRAYRVELDPTVAQRQYLTRAAGVARVAYNWALAEWRAQYRVSPTRIERLLTRLGAKDPKACRAAYETRHPARKAPNAYALHTLLTSIKTEKFPWMREVTAYAVREAVKDVGLAYDNFFRRLAEGVRGREAGRPRFRSRAKYGLGWHADQGSAITTTREALSVPGVGLVRVKNGRRGYVPETKFSSRTKTWSGPKVCGVGFREVAGRWYASVRMEVPRPAARVARGVGTRVGVEVGVRELAVTSGGTRVGGVRDLASIQRAERRLKLWQRRASRRYRDGKPREAQSAGWREAQTEVQKYFAEVARCRGDLLHKTSRKLVDLGIETLVMRDMQVKAMLRRDNKRTPEAARARNALAPMVAAVGMFELRRQVEYKQQWAGGALVKAPNDYPSTRRCSACGEVRGSDPPYPSWTCTGCGVVHDREQNSAQNLKDFTPPSGGALAGGGTRRRKTSRKAGTMTEGSGTPGASVEQSIGTAGPHGAEEETPLGAPGLGNQARGKPRGKGTLRPDPAGIPSGNGGEPQPELNILEANSERLGGVNDRPQAIKPNPEGRRSPQASRSQSGMQVPETVGHPK